MAEWFYNKGNANMTASLHIDKTKVIVHHIHKLIPRTPLCSYCVGLTPLSF